jgi:hypothetical protein
LYVATSIASIYLKTGMKVRDREREKKPIATKKKLFYPSCIASRERKGVKCEFYCSNSKVIVAPNG